VLSPAEQTWFRHDLTQVDASRNKRGSGPSLARVLIDALEDYYRRTGTEMSP
jgi:hypothetical protein